MTDDIESAITEATNAAVEESGGAPKPEPEETVETQETVTEEPEKEAASEGETEEAKPNAEETPEETAEEEDEPLNLSAADLKAINDDPKLLAVYKSMQRGLTKKSQDFAEKRKQHESDLEAIDFIRTDPDRALELMAQNRGYLLVKKDGKDAAVDDAKQAATEVATDLVEKYAKQLGPESAKILVPIIQEITQAVTEQTVKPIAERTQFLDKSARESGVAAAVDSFGANIREQGEEWSDEILTDMAAMMDRVVPGEKTDIQTYLQTLYNAVTSERGRKAALKSELARLRRAKNEAEPTRSVRPAPKREQQITAEMSERDAIALATSLAEQEARAG